MARMFPKSKELMGFDATQGEKEVYDILNRVLGDECFVFHEIRLQGRHADFLIIIPERGILILEVKDWQSKTIHKWYADKVYKYEGAIIKLKEHPLNQGKAYMRNLINMLNGKKKLFVNPSKEKHKEILGFAYDVGVIFTRMKKDEFQNITGELKDYRKKYLFQEELQNLNEQKLYKSLIGMFSYKFDKSFLKQNDRIKIITDTINYRVRYQSNKEIIRKGDGNIAEIVKNIGYGKISIYGAPGTGKTLFVIERAKYLLETHRDWNILIVCETDSQVKLINGKLRKYMCERLTISTIDNFINSECNKYLSEDFKVYPNTMKIDNIINQKKELGIMVYDAILADEVLNFKEEYITYLIRGVLRTEDNSHLVMTFDGYQNMKRDKYKPKYAQIKDHKIIELDISHRNTQQILNFIKRVFTDKYMPIYIASNDVDKFDYGFLSEESITEGEEPKVLKCDDFNDEIEQIINILNVKKGISAVICFGDKEKKEILKSFQKMVLPSFDICEFDRNDTKEYVLVGLASELKGLQFDNVCVVGIKNKLLGRYEYDFTKMLYIACTRAKENLYIAISEENIYSAILSNDLEMLGKLDKMRYNKFYTVKFVIYKYNEDLDEYEELYDNPIEMQCTSLEDILEMDNCNFWFSNKDKEQIIKELRERNEGENILIEKDDNTRFLFTMIRTKLEGISSKRLELLDID